ncbi:MAG: GBT family porin [Idiomarinaceae bacterium HL-53]|nr:MAG: GBT family porin [Idiomarinaceae bacterium HL-53]CUS48343.1 porin [Idiomarinaceae bacterium HL-53]
MKRSQLLVLACFSLIALPAIAQTNDVEIDFYGRIQMSAAYLHDGDDGGLNVASNSSRLGLNMSYQLDENLTVLGKLEKQVDFAEGSGSFGSRDAFIGLSGNFGTVRMGYFVSPSMAHLSSVEEFRDRIGDGRNMLRRGAMNLDRRYKSSLGYQTPNMNGFVWAIHYGTEEQDGVTVTNDNDMLSTSLQYKTGGWTITGSFQQDNRTDTTIDGTRFSVMKSGDDWRFAVLAQQVSGLEEGDMKGWLLNGRYRLTEQVWFKAQVGARSYDQQDNESTLATIGFDRIISPRLTVYTVATMTNNDSAGVASVTEGGFGKSLPVIAGNDPFAISAGVSFRF